MALRKVHTSVLFTIMMKRQSPIVGGARIALGTRNTLLTQRIKEGQLTRSRILIKGSSMRTSAINIVANNQTETLPKDG